MMDSFQKEIEEISNDLHASELSASTQEVSYCIAEYAAHQIQKMVKCDECSQKVLAENPTNVYKCYLDSLSRDGLKNPSESLADFVGNGFALLDCSSRIIGKFSNSLSCRALALEVLHTYNNNCYFSCKTHEKSAKKFCVNNSDKHFFQ